jgi:AcrR family transcriptional regulator
MNMAPRIVDKEQRRKDIASACADLIHEVGIRKLTVAQVAKTAGIGKGTIYEYFENKDDIVFEIINIHIEHSHNEFLETIKDVKTTKEKLLLCFKFVLDDSEENLKHFNGYKEYISIVLSDENTAMREFNSSCNEFFDIQLRKIIQEGIDQNELIPQSISLAEGLLVFEKGLALLKMSEKDFDAKKIGESFLNNLWELMVVKNDK